MGFCPVDPDGDLSTGGAELLEQSAVGTDPQVLLCDFHLKQTRMRGMRKVRSEGAI